MTIIWGRIAHKLIKKINQNIIIVIIIKAIISHHRNMKKINHPKRSDNLISNNLLHPLVKRNHHQNINISHMNINTKADMIRNIKIKVAPNYKIKMQR